MYKVTASICRLTGERVLAFVVTNLYTVHELCHDLRRRVPPLSALRREGVVTCERVLPFVVNNLYLRRRVPPLSALRREGVVTSVCYYQNVYTV